MLLVEFLRRTVRRGCIRYIDSADRHHVVGESHLEPQVIVRSRSRRLDWLLSARPTLLVGEAYMAGAITIEHGTLYDFIAIVASQEPEGARPIWVRLLDVLRSPLRQFNSVERSRRNVAHHYDLSGALYRLFLDADRQYSCAYFRTPHDTLEQAQANKKAHIAAKLLLDRPGLQILDIGSGWGGLGLYLADVADADVTGVTLSTEQHAASVERAAQRGLSERAQFHLRDYRHVRGRYDRIVSVGMFEHVGRRNYPEFFKKLGDLMEDDGIAVLHSIGFNELPGPIDPFIQKYIFPGADLPTLSEVLKVIEASGLLVSDVEVLQYHYADTLAHWRARFMANWQAAAAIYDERFCRMWEYYLVLCEVGFRFRDMMVFQIVLAHKKSALPATRDHMVDWERGQAPRVAERVR